MNFRFNGCQGEMMESQETNNEMWRAMLTGDFTPLNTFRTIFKHVPAEPRCPICYAPFKGFGAPFARLLGKKPSALNPRFCNDCDRFAVERPGGAELEI